MGKWWQKPCPRYSPCPSVPACSQKQTPEQLVLLHQWEGAFLNLKPTRAISGQQLRKGEVLHWRLSRWGGGRQTGTSGISDMSDGRRWRWGTAGLKQQLTEAVNQSACFCGPKICHHVHNICHSETKSSPHRSQRGTLNIFTAWAVSNAHTLPALWCKTSCFNLRAPTATAIQRLTATR